MTKRKQIQNLFATLEDHIHLDIFYQPPIYNKKTYMIIYHEQPFKWKKCGEKLVSCQKHPTMQCGRWGLFTKVSNNRKYSSVRAQIHVSKETLFFLPIPRNTRILILLSYATFHLLEVHMANTRIGMLIITLAYI